MNNWATNLVRKGGHFRGQFEASEGPPGTRNKKLLFGAAPLFLLDDDIINVVSHDMQQHTTGDLRLTDDLYRASLGRTSADLGNSLTLQARAENLLRTLSNVVSHGTSRLSCSKYHLRNTKYHGETPNTNIRYMMQLFMGLRMSFVYHDIKWFLMKRFFFYYYYYCYIT